MNSINKRKSRRKVVASKRHNSSSRSLSSLKLSVTSANSKYKIRALLKNNKSLAVALQDAKGELSEKQKLLENAAKHFKSIMQARVLMLGMYSDLQSFVEKFDGALSLLTVDDIKITDLIVPLKSCGQFKSKVKRLAESVQQVSEENSFSVMAENANCDISMTESLNQIIPSDHNPSVDSNAMEVTNNCVDKQTTNFEAEHCLPLKVSIENTSTFNEIIPNAVNSRLPVTFCENLEEAVDPSVGKMTSPTKNDTLKNRESSGTPRLSIVSINMLKNSEVLPNCINTQKNSEVLPNFKASVSCKVPSSLGKVITNVLNTHASSSNVKSSKIPRLFNSSTTPKVQLNLPDNVLKQSDTSSEKSLKISENSDFGMARRKTFVVKNNDTLATNSESSSTSNIHEIRNEDFFATTESRQTSSRKTFVVKVTDVPKDERKSISNRRKTFVKKKYTTDNKIRKSMKNRRGTFVISETKEDCNNENVTTVTEISTSNDLVKAKCLLSEGKLFEELPVVCDKTNEITTFQESLDNIDIPSKIISLKNQSEQIPFQGKDIMSETNKTTLEQGFKVDSNCDEKIGNSDDKENLCKAETNKTTLEQELKLDSNCDGKDSNSMDTIESSNICGTSKECVESVMSNDIEIVEVKNKCYSRSQKRVSYKMFLESSDSECESIPNLDFSFVKESSDKPIPIRKQISGSQKKKVFVFDSHKRKSKLSKKSPSKVKEISRNHVRFEQDLNCVSHPDNTNIKNKDVIIELSKCQGNENIMEYVSGDFTCNKSSNNKNGNEYCETSDNNQEILQSAVTNGKDTDISRSTPNENLSASKSGENGIKNSLSLFNSPVIASHKFLNAIESDKDLVCGKGQGNIICETKTKSKKEYSKSSKRNQVINKPLKDCSVDSISVQKSSKRNYSKKESEQTITADMQETNRGNTLLQNQNKEKQTKKKNKTKSTKSRKKSPASMSNDNTIVVVAEVHSPAQEYFTTSETTGFNKENRNKLESENCLVLLNDIFKPSNIDMLSKSCKNKMVSNGRNIPLKNPLSDNSCNIPPVEDSHIAKNEESIASDVQEGMRYRKRNKRVNYTEPSLTKKLRK